ncbi:histidine phosphatase family protein [uncultured Flavobacterium sp.]|uniref:SixA phosphatase family protein n=1 Tax=uncultured Flavobacterium sp. TaxID=165435 RepID=UPI0025ED0A29|nr:histidine phosphatase family protein [uncultured Flavobacterium sp.]
MKSLYLILTVLIMNVSSWAQDNTTTIYLIRHAEKADASNDPHLSAAGQQRAEKWAAHFANKDIAAIYSTGFNRTRETAQPLATAKGLQITEYGDDFYLGTLVKKLAGKSIVVVGHSNTLPKQINMLLSNGQFGNIAESEYSQLYTITVVDGVPTAKVEKI